MKLTAQDRRELAGLNPELRAKLANNVKRTAARDYPYELFSALATLRDDFAFLFYKDKRIKAIEDVVAGFPNTNKVWQRAYTSLQDGIRALEEASETVTEDSTDFQTPR